MELNALQHQFLEHAIRATYYEAKRSYQMASDEWKELAGKRLDAIGGLLDEIREPSGSFTWSMSSQIDIE